MTGIQLHALKLSLLERCQVCHLPSMVYIPHAGPDKTWVGNYKLE